MKKTKTLIATLIFLSSSIVTLGQWANTNLGTGAGNLGNYNVAIGKEAQTNLTGHYNVGVGYNSMFYTTSGSRNTALGFQSLKFNKTGGYNTATGYNAMRDNKTGSYNVASGINALYKNVSGSNNTAIGSSSLYNTTSGGQNTALGEGALYNNTTGSYNTAIGRGSLHESTTASFNTASGYNSMWSNTTGYANTAMGSSSLRDNTTGYANTAIGSSSLRKNISGQGNTGVGDFALYSNTSGHQNTAIGVRVLRSNTSGEGNVGTGNSSLYSNTTGDHNTATGFEALYFNTTGVRNSAVGFRSLRHNTTGAYNTTIGYRSLYRNTTGTSNSALGYEALNLNTTGRWNTASGAVALKDNTSGSRNTAYGYNSLQRNTIGERNTAGGHWSLAHNVTGNCNTALGDIAGPSATMTGLNNTTALGCQALVTASNSVVIGNTSVTSIGGEVDWTVLSDGRFKKEIKEDLPGLAFITQLRPVSYTVDKVKLSKFLGKGSPEYIVETENSEYRETGFIAQEVESIVQESGYTFNGVDGVQNENEVYGLRYGMFVVPLVKAVQELNDKTETQTATIEQLREIVNLQQKQIRTLLGTNMSDTNTVSPPTSSLSQIYPNPFNETATIEMTIDNSIQEAKVFIYNLEGKELVSYPVNTRGKTSVQISGSELASGTYLYTLITDGKIVNTKRMILTK